MPASGAVQLQRAGWKVPMTARALRVLACLTSPIEAAGQPAPQPLAQMHHTTWDQQDGLPLSRLVHVVRSPDGYLWLGSSAGLLRFDGVRFTVLHGLTTPELQSAPMWFQTWWFGSILFLSVAATGALVVYTLQRARARREAERLRARFEATLIERTRLARELHDTLLQGFTGITLQIQAVHRSVAGVSPEAATVLARVLALADTTLRDARQMVWDMRAPELDDHDLAEALEGAARGALVGSAIDLHFTVSGDRRRLMLGVETAVLRIGREAVVNAVKHGDPHTVDVALTYEPRRVQLFVRDDGRGFDPAEVNWAGDGGHWGLRGMRERASRAGGQLEIVGTPGRGTIISLHLPVDGDA